MSVYLSRLVLNTRDRTVRQGIADCHALHARVLDAFPRDRSAEGRAREAFGVLYRLEPESASGSGLRLLVQSTTEPDWARLPEGYVLPPWECKDIEAAYGRLRAGDELRFRLRANPTKRVAVRNPAEEARRHGQRVELRSEEAQLEWLRRKGEHGGFALLDVRTAAGLPDVRADPNPKVTGRRGAGEGRPAAQLTFGAALFEGRLRVTNAEAFRASLVRGIGSGKAYGFGLLSIGRG